MNFFTLLIAVTIASGCSESTFSSQADKNKNSGKKIHDDKSQNSPNDDVGDDDGNDDGHDDGSDDGQDDGNGDDGNDDDKDNIDLVTSSGDKSIIESDDISVGEGEKCYKDPATKNFFKTLNNKATFQKQTNSVAYPYPPQNKTVGFSIDFLTFVKKNSHPKPFITNTAPNMAGLSLFLSDVESFDINLSKPMRAIGFDFYEPTGAIANAPVHDSKFTVSLFDGTTAVGKVRLFNGKDNTVEFQGIWSKTPFNRIEIRDVTNTIDNEVFGTMNLSDKDLNPDDC